ncbi:S8 family serine peptidase [Nonomuraea wenchangensis]
MSFRLPARRSCLLAGAALVASIVAVPTPATAAPPSTPAPAPAALGGRVAITLVTGDEVTYDTTGGVPSVTVTPATRSDGSTSTFVTYKKDGDTYVVPLDVRPYLASGAVDEGLFNVTYLARNGYAARQDVPVIAQYAKGARTAQAKVPGAETKRRLSTMNSAALEVDKSPQFWKSVQNPDVRPADAPKHDKLRLSGGMDRLWLDRVSRISLDESVPLVGAPKAWAAGYDGAGVKVAVLDTGIDRTHPDLAGKVVAEADFSGSQDATDRHGHGTHVASTIAGSGAAGGGAHKGVAPGASLLVAKVCDDRGDCLNSSVIAGMEWAAEQGADVVNLSLGGEAPLDYPDPQSQAVDELTEESGTLFVIAAGNNGQDESIGSPGVARAALTVAATDNADRLASFSSRGPIWYADRTLKPDIAAPGVDITAARAAQSSWPGDLYTDASGTSMATPHVAGAAAVLAQRHPDWTPDRLKAALMSTSKDVRLKTFEAGAGRLDVARAVSQPVHAATPAVDLGILSRDQQKQSRPVTYANGGSEPVTLTLAASLVTGSGDQAPAGAVTTDTTVTVPAGGTATATVSVDVPALSNGIYSGAVTATDATGGIVVRVPVAFQVEPQSFPVKFEILGHDGKPCGTSDRFGCYAIPALTYVNHDTGRTGTPRSLTDRLTVGRHSFQAAVAWSDPDTWEPQYAVVVAEDIKVTGPMTVTLDASKARRIVVETPKPSQSLDHQIGVIRTSKSGARTGFGLLGGFGSYGYWAVPTPKVTDGSLLFQHQSDAVAPLVEMEVLGKEKRRLHPQYINYYESVTKFSGVQPLDVTYLGVMHALSDPASQIPKDLSGVKGKLALIEIEDDWDGVSARFGCHVFPEYLDALTSAGAAGVVAFMKVDGTPHKCDTRNTFTPFHQPAIPAVSLPPNEGRALRDQAASGNRTSIRVQGTPTSPYVYHLKFYRMNEIPAEQTYRVSDRELARFDYDYHAERPVDVVTAWHQWLPGRESDIVQINTRLRGPKNWQNYVGPATQPDQLVKAEVHRSSTDLEIIDDAPVPAMIRPVSAGKVVEGDWWGSPAVPGAPEFDQPATWLAVCGACRQGDVFSPLLPMAFTDPHVESFYLETSQSDRLHLYRDGQEIPPTPLLGAITAYTLPPERARYRLTHEMDILAPNMKADFHDRRVSSEWEFTSSQVKADDKGRLGCIGARLELSDEPCAVQPLVYLRYDLNLDLDNTTRRGVHRIELHAYHEVAATPGPAIASIEAWVSYDGEKTWQKAGTGTPKDGTVTAVLPTPPAGKVTASLKVKASDTAGNTITQTVHEAYGVR